jgi:RNA polymerase sigma factor (sigma-70 family)
MKERRSDITGLKFGPQDAGVVLGPIDPPREHGEKVRRVWHCRCACGAEFVAMAVTIQNNKRAYCSLQCPAREHKEAPGSFDYARLRCIVAKPGGHKRVSDDEKTAIVLASGRGDRRAQELLLLLHEGFVRTTVNLYAGRKRRIHAYDIEELEQECRLGLLNASASWDPELGAFTTYARYEMINMMERQPNSGMSTIAIAVNAHRGKTTKAFATRARHMVSLDAPISSDDSRTRMDLLAESMWVDVHEHEPADSIESMLDRLKPKQRDAIVKHFFQGKTMIEIASMDGLTKEGIRKRILDGLAIIKKHVAEA